MFTTQDFTELVALERLDDSTFRSIHLAFAPAGGDRTYGGHVFMQVCTAAWFPYSDSFTNWTSFTGVLRSKQNRTS